MVQGRITAALALRAGTGQTGRPERATPATASPDEFWLDGPAGRFRVRLRGAGWPLVLVPGGPGCGRDVFSPWLDKLARECLLADYDPAGSGRSRPAAGPVTLEAQVAEIKAIVESIGRPAVVLGHSFGGLPAQLFALRHPELCAGLALVCAATGLPAVEAGRRRFGETASPGLRRRVEARFARLIRRHPEAAADAVATRLHLGYWRCYYRHRPPLWYLPAAAAGQSDPGFARALEASAAGTDLSGRFAACPVPTLIIEAPGDTVWPPGKAAALAANHPGAALALFRRSGHSPFVDESRRFRRVLLVWLRSLPPG
jgi:proline iminopeptidase